MPEKFTSFVIFAEMRTGSNLLEATLNSVKKVTCFGEAFNPYMMGWPNKDELQGITQKERDADPMKLLNKLFDKPDHLSGFRYFHDHDPRVFDAIMNNRKCAKIILTRNPLDSYVSTQLAWETNQWKLNQTETPIPAAITYDGKGFREAFSEIHEFQLKIMHALQASGQSGFWLGYRDLRDSDVMTGLLHWLGRNDVEKVSPANDQVPQNPREMSKKVRNFDEMRTDLQEMDPFAIYEVPNFEPHRGPAVPSFVASEAGKGLLYMPIKGGAEIPYLSWLEAMGEVRRDFTQNTLRQWKRQHSGHRSFTILQHPLHRAWRAFLHLLTAASAELRQLMRDVYRMGLHADDELTNMSDEQSSKLFREFLDFLNRNLNGQTSLPTHPQWATQSAIIAGFSKFSQPDMLIREDRLAEELEYLCKAVKIKEPHLNALDPETYPDFLGEADIQQTARSVYARDYMAFGFSKTP